jgi:predicted ArsR family transcriptional regulator
MTDPGPQQLPSALLEALRREGPHTAEELAELLGVHPFGVAQALRRLAGKRLVVSTGNKIGHSKYFGSPRRVVVWAASA